MCALGKRNVFGGSGSAWVAQLVERVLGKDEVTGSIPVPGSRNLWGEESSGRRENLESSGGNSTVESHSSKVMVAGSNPVPRSKVWPGSLAVNGLSLRMRAYGEREIRAHQAAREHWDDRAHRPWQDHVDRGDHQGAQQAQSEGGFPRV